MNNNLGDVTQIIYQQQQGCNQLFFYEERYHSYQELILSLLKEVSSEQNELCLSQRITKIAENAIVTLENGTIKYGSKVAKTGIGNDKQKQRELIEKISGKKDVSKFNFEEMSKEEQEEELRKIKEKLEEILEKAGRSLQETTIPQEVFELELKLTPPQKAKLLKILTETKNKPPADQQAIVLQFLRNIQEIDRKRRKREAAEQKKQKEIEKQEIRKANKRQEIQKEEKGIPPRKLTARQIIAETTK